jgi:hypothetical protein
VQPKLVALGLLTFACSTATPPAAIELLESATAEPAITPPVTSTTPEEARFPGGPRLWRVDPATLAKVDVVGEESPGWWIEEVAAREDEIVMVGSNEAGWALWHLDLRNHALDLVTEGSGQRPVGLILRQDSVEWLTTWNEPRTIAEFPDGLQIHRVDRETEVTTRTTLEVPSFFADEAVVFDGGRRLGLFGSSVDDRVPRLVVFELSSGRAVVDVTFESLSILVGGIDTTEFGWMEPAWDRTRNRLYVPHLYSNSLRLSISSQEILRTTPFSLGPRFSIDS